MGRLVVQSIFRGPLLVLIFGINFGILMLFQVLDSSNNMYFLVGFFMFIVSAFR